MSYFNDTEIKTGLYLLLQALFKWVLHFNASLVSWDLFYVLDKCPRNADKLPIVVLFSL